MSEQTKNPSAGDALAAAERVADLAHELRSPLGGIESMIALLGESKSASDQDALIAGLRSAAAHLRTVANTLLKPETRTAHTVTVSDALRFFSVSARSRARSVGMAFHQEIEPGCGNLIIGDGTALRQMLENLVDNAIRHSGANEIALHVKPSAADTQQVRFEVTDCGKGMDPTVAARLNGEVTAGAGMGLSIVSRLARAQGGSSGVAARGDGPGCCVWFTTPVVGLREAARSAVVPEEQLAAPILVVEDDAVNQLLLKTVLGHLGHAVETTHSPIQALELLRVNHYSAIFSDMSMPEMDGWNFIRQMRANGCNLPIVGVTGHVLAEDKKRTMDAGANWVVEKPVTVHDLRQALIAIGLRDPMLRQVSAA